MRSSMTDSLIRSEYVRSVWWVIFSSMSGLLVERGGGGGRRGVRDLDVDRHVLIGAGGVDRPRRRRGVAVVSAVRDADVIGLREDAVRRIEALPADVRDVQLHPRVARVRARTRVAVVAR